MLLHTFLPHTVSGQVELREVDDFRGTPGLAYNMMQTKPNVEQTISYACRISRGQSACAVR